MLKKANSLETDTLFMVAIGLQFNNGTDKSLYLTEWSKCLKLNFLPLCFHIWSALPSQAVLFDIFCLFVSVFVWYCLFVVFVFNNLPKARVINWESTSIIFTYKHALGAPSWMVIYLGGPSPLWVVSPLNRLSWGIKNANWASQEPASQ